MKHSTYQYLYNDVISALHKKQLLSALQSLQGMAVALKSWSLKEETDTLIESYQILLSYMKKGVADPERKKMYEGFTRRAYELAEVLKRSGLINNDESFYAASFRTLQQLYGTDFALTDILNKASLPRDKFDVIWLSAAWIADDELTVSNFMADHNVAENEKCLLLSATTLAAMHFFDIAKYRLLLDYALSTNMRLRVRAIVGLIFTHIMYAERITFYPDVMARLQLMSDIPQFINEIESLQVQLFLSLETKRIEHNLQEEIIPQMMKRLDELHIVKGNGTDEQNEEMGEFDFNPEWSERVNDSKLQAYMHDFVELQHRGADMYMGSFKIMKQRFTFFNTVSNWFWPFTFNHPEIPDSARDNKFVKLMISNDVLCDSDKYSFCLMATHLPKATKNDKLQDELYEQMQAIKHEREENADKMFKNELRSYVQGFYRFSYLYLHHEQFTNPFQHDLFIVNYPPFDSLICNDDIILRLANFVFKDKSYALAKKMFKKLSANNRSSETLQKLGVCYEQEGDIKQAIKCYKQADLLHKPSTWTMKRLAHCYCQIADYQNALNYYNELAKQDSNNVHIALRQAECYIQLKQYDEAFKFLFKADYLQPNSHLTERAIAWCSLLTKKYSQAENYYTKILKDSPTSTDFLNAGHSAWLIGNISNAVERYKKALELNGNQSSTFLSNDRDMLIIAGKTEEDIAMMTDVVITNL